MAIFFKWVVPHNYIPEVHYYPVLTGVDEEDGKIYWMYPEMTENQYEELKDKKYKDKRRRMFV